MHKREYFIKALNAGAYRHKAWVIGSFSMTRHVEARYSEQDYYDYRLYPDAEKDQYYFQNPENREEKIYLVDSELDTPLFRFLDVIDLAYGDLPNLKKNITSTYGTMLFNAMVLVYAFNDKVAYMEGRIAVPAVEKIIEARLQDDPKPGEQVKADPNVLYITEYKRYNEAMFALAGFTQLCVPSATPKTMTTDPNIVARRTQLLEEYKDRLHDPVIQAKIDQELIAMDRAWMKGDEGEGFYIKDKSYDVVRKKTLLMQGSVQGFGVKGDLVETSLNEGWDIKNLPAMSNSLRDGSYSRGAETMLGGEATKFNYRIFQNTVISEEDCGSQFGIEVEFDELRGPRFLSSSVITAQGLVEITEATLPKFMGKTVRVRSPIYCQTKGANFCAVCIGRKIATTPQAISTYAADVGSMFLAISMSAMHGKSLKVAKYDLAASIR